MKDREEEPMIVLIFKAFAILCWGIGAWYLILFFGQESGDDALAAIGEARYKMLITMSLCGTGFTLFWMGEVCGLLARILSRLGSEGVAAQAAPLRKEPSPRPQSQPAPDAAVYKLD